LRRREGATSVGLGTSLAVLASTVLKHVIRRRRPSLATDTPLSSFPSSHSAAWAGYIVGLALSPLASIDRSPSGVHASASL
jgi:membrane-associated phospholipid phosphatase